MVTSDLPPIGSLCRIISWRSVYSSAQFNKFVCHAPVDELFIPLWHAPKVFGDTERSLAVFPGLGPTVGYIWLRTTDPDSPAWEQLA